MGQSNTGYPRYPFDIHPVAQSSSETNKRNSVESRELFVDPPVVAVAVAVMTLCSPFESSSRED